MTGLGHDGRGRQALESLTDLARESVRPPEAAKLDRGLFALSARLERQQSRQRSFWRWSMAGATVTVAVALTVFLFARGRTPQTAALAYTVAGGSVVDGGYLRESSRAGVVLSFSEGTEVALPSGTRARLRAVDSAGARIAIENGTARFRITPSNHGRWLVDVGPFLVTVKGTVFSVRWDAPVERFELNLDRGIVSVSGPMSGSDITLFAGQRLIADLASGETRILEDKAVQPEKAATEAPLPVPAATDRTPAKERPALQPALSSEPREERRWAQPVAAGQWDRILDDAERVGIKRVLDTASSDDLCALADAARYRHRESLARQALLAERRRFPTSPRALDAAFFLGRVEESADARVALRWYGDYLSHAPNGAYTDEALGRTMILTGKTAGASQAQPIAEEYLRRFPSGSYAGAARALWRER